MYIKLYSENVSRFVEESNIRKIEKLRRNFFVEPELDKYGNIKKYSSDEVIEYLGGKANVKDLNSIFGITPRVNRPVQSGISIKDTTPTKKTTRTKK